MTSFLRIFQTSSLPKIPWSMLYPLPVLNPLLVRDAHEVYYMALYGLLAHTESPLPLRSLLVRPLLPLVGRRNLFL